MHYRMHYLGGGVQNNQKIWKAESAEKERSRNKVFN